MNLSVSSACNASRLGLLKRRKMTRPEVLAA
jgi:hypothetical protein